MFVCTHTHTHTHILLSEVSICVYIDRYTHFFGSPGGTVVKDPLAMQEMVGLIPGSGRSPGEGNGYPLHYSCLGSLMDGGARQATAHGVVKSLTPLSNWTTATILHPSDNRRKTAGSVKGHYHPELPPHAHMCGALYLPCNVTLGVVLPLLPVWRRALWRQMFCLLF